MSNDHSEKIVAKVYVTTDYKKFKRLDGNRAIQEARIKKIIASIRKVGYVLSPIVVNENIEIIDGQARLEAFKRLNLPVYYVVAEGAGIDECIAMNINQTGWTLTDYIDSYADTGNISYVYLSQLLKAYKGIFQNKVILNIATGKVERSNGIIKEGRFSCDATMYNESQRVLSWLKNFRQPIDRVDGHTEYYYMALAFCYSDPEIDNDKLIGKVTQLQANLIPVTTIQQALEQLENVYNNRSHNKVYIVTNYRKYMEGKYAWYGNKYGNKYSD